MRYTLFFILFISNFAIAQRNTLPGLNTDSLKRVAAEQKARNKKLAAKTQFQYFVIKAENKTFGYDVYADGNLYLHQNTIPAIGGNLGFADTSKAGATARLAIKKIKQGETPPTITVEELKKIKAIH